MLRRYDFPSLELRDQNLFQQDNGAEHKASSVKKRPAKVGVEEQSSVLHRALNSTPPFFFFGHIVCITHDSYLPSV